MSKTIKSIILEYLKSNGYDGLYSPSWLGCGCRLEDLMPCDNPHPQCMPGVAVDDEEWDFRIVPRKLQGDL